MKKVFVILGVCCALFVSAILLFLPKQQEVNTTGVFHSNVGLMNRAFADAGIWKKCLGEDSDTVASMDGYAFSVVQAAMNQVSIQVSSINQAWMSEILMVMVSKDSVVVNWSAKLQPATGLFDRISRYREANELRSIQQKVLSRFSSYLADASNVYGYTIVPGQMTDSIVVTRSFVTAAYPTLEEIYAQIQVLDQQVQKANAHATNAPMLFVQRNREGDGFKTQVAIPVDTWLAEEGGSSARRMVLGNNLTAEVTGPRSKIDSLFKAMYQYVSDFNKTMPGIPYEMLLTNRMQVSDSLKWKTRVYFPVME